MDPKDILRKITGKNVWLTSRGNQSILQALMIAKNLGKKKVLIPDQGGWLTYRTLPGLLGMELEVIETNDGYLDSDMSFSNDSVILLASLAGYCIQLPMDEIVKKAHLMDCLVIDDISGTIGRDVCQSADITICSFGRWKPINLTHGGMVGVSDEIKSKIDIKEFKGLDKFGGDLEELTRLLENVKERQNMFQEVSRSIKKDLNKKYNIVHEDKDGINVLIKCSGQQKEEVKKYCENKGYECTECPRYIRMNSEGISIEVKRLR